MPQGNHPQAIAPRESPTQTDREPPVTDTPPWQNPQTPLGRHFTLGDLCTCSQTYRQNPEAIAPYPQQPASLDALRALAETLLDPLADRYGGDRLVLAYGFCSADLRRWLNQRDPATGRKRGRVDPRRDQHAAAERTRTGRPVCDRGGAACDFYIAGEPSDRLVDWILAAQLPFDSLYFYGRDRPIHLSHGPQHKRAIWTFGDRGEPTRRGIEAWVRQAQGDRGHCPSG